MDLEVLESNKTMVPLTTNEAAVEEEKVIERVSLMGYAQIVHGMLQSTVIPAMKEATAKGLVPQDEFIKFMSELFARVGHAILNQYTDEEQKTVLFELLNSEGITFLVQDFEKYIKKAYALKFVKNMLLSFTITQLSLVLHQIISSAAQTTPEPTGGPVNDLIQEGEDTAASTDNN